MALNIYSIIWADDECDTLQKDKAIRKLFNEKRIEVIKFVPTSEALKNALEFYKDKVDAVVIDGNFSKEDVEYVERNDISGLIHSISFLELFQVKRDIPFFLYTARYTLLQEICKNGEIDYFTQNERLLQKGQIEKLANKIIKDVDHIHSIEFMVKKRYKPLLEMARRISNKCEGNLHQFLLDEARDNNFSRSVDMFTDLRKILEVIVDKCKENQITPELINSLNDFKHYWSNKGHRCGIKPKNNTILPMPIAASLWGLIA